MNYQILKDVGINTDEVIRRFGGKDVLFQKYILKFLDDTNFSDLKNAMAEKDYEKAFTFSHTLKGVLGNLSINSVYSPLCDFVECLRNNSDTQKAIASFPNLCQNYDDVITAIKNSKS